MSPEAAIYIVRAALKLILMLSGPALMAGLVIGLMVSIFQAATQIQEQTLTFIPKLAAIFGMLMFLFPWMIKLMYQFSRELIMNSHRYLQ